MAPSPFENLGRTLDLHRGNSRSPELTSHCERGFRLLKRTLVLMRKNGKKFLETILDIKLFLACSHLIFLLSLFMFEQDCSILERSGHLCSLDVSTCSHSQHTVSEITSHYTVIYLIQCKFNYSIPSGVFQFKV